jgi:hypothetical protein
MDLTQPVKLTPAGPPYIPIYVLFTHPYSIPVDSGYNIDNILYYPLRDGIRDPLRFPIRYELVFL